MLLFFHRLRVSEAKAGAWEARFGMHIALENAKWLQHNSLALRHMTASSHIFT